MKKIRLAWLSTHPIQYQAPLLRKISDSPDIDLTALFFSDFSTREFVDAEFGTEIKWDTPLLEGYKHIFLEGNGGSVDQIKTFSPQIRGLSKLLNKDNFDVVLVQGWQHYGMLQAAWLAKRSGLKVLMRCEATDHVASAKGIKGLLRKSVVSFLLSQVDQFMAIGSHNRDFYLSRGIKKENIGSMPYCVDNEFFQAKSESVDTLALRGSLGLDENRPVILYSSKMIKRKYPDQLLKAYKNLDKPRPYLIFVGDGELRDELERYAYDQKLEDVFFLGFVNQTELPKYYALADVFILPSVDETWGLVINEAMNAKCAIITTENVGSARDLVTDEINGFVINGEEDLVLGLTKAIGACMDAESLEKMKLESHKRIQNWGIDENVTGLRAALGLESFN